MVVAENSVLHYVFLSCFQQLPSDTVLVSVNPSVLLPVPASLEAKGIAHP